MIQHSFRWKIVKDSNKPVEVFIIEDVSKSANTI